MNKENLLEDALETITTGIIFIRQFLSEESVEKLRESAQDNLVVPEVYDKTGEYQVKLNIRNHRIRRSGLVGLNVESVKTGMYVEFLEKINQRYPDFKEISLLEVQVTEKDQFFDWHADNFGTLNRKLSVLCWLNDGFEGGETEFLTEDGVVGLRGDPGDAVLFDPNIWHRGAPVTLGKKITVLGIVK